MELDRKDWENVKRVMEAQLKDVLISSIIANSNLKLANEALKNFPEEEKKEEVPAGVN